MTDRPATRKNLITPTTIMSPHFRIRGASFRSVSVVQAVSGADLELRAGRCLALVGESPTPPM
jgi:ABC-type oligopeptide transport system ATPase subunit